MDIRAVEVHMYDSNILQLQIWTLPNIFLKSDYVDQNPFLEHIFQMKRARFITYIVWERIKALDDDSHLCKITLEPWPLPETDPSQCL